mgnify:CR=1 FL=1
MLKAIMGRLLGRPTLPDKLSYEAAREALERHSARLHRDLASRPEAEPEILYYLAGDRDPDIRRRVAANPSTPAKADRRLADDPDGGVREELARKIGRLVPELDAAAHARIRDLAIQTLQCLARDQLPRVRAIIADAVKDSATAPRDLVRRLALDEDDAIACAVVEYSPLLNDADLKEIVDLARVSERLAAVARRRGLSAAVCDAVVARADIGAIAALIANETAQIGDQALEAILAKAAEIEAWHAPLAMRPNLSERVLRRIAGFVSSALIERMARRPGLDAATELALKAAARRRIETGGGGALPSESERRVQAALKAGRLDEAFIGAAAEAGERDVVAMALAALVRVPPAVATRILDSRSARAVTALVWKAGLAMRVSVEIQSFVLKLPARERLLARGGTDFPLGPEEMATHLELFGIGG